MWCAAFQYGFFSQYLERKKLKFLLTQEEIGGTFGPQGGHKLLACRVSRVLLKGGIL
jgi:hypothetical protein